MVSTLICEISSQGSTPDFPPLINALIAQMVEHLKGNKMAKITFNTKLDKLFALSFELKKIMSDIEKRAALLEKSSKKSD